MRLRHSRGLHESGALQRLDIADDEIIITSINKAKAKNVKVSRHLLSIFFLCPETHYKQTLKKISSPVEKQRPSFVVMTS